MATYGYSIKGMTETRAHASVRDVPMSYKTAVMIARRIKGLPAEKALRFLDDVVTQKQAVPFTTFNDGFGHKPGIGPGRYPQKAAKIYTQLLRNAVANAEDKGLGKDVYVEFVVPQQGSRPWHSGRQGRRKFKRANIELVVTNIPVGKDAARAAKKAAYVAKPKVEKKTEHKKTETTN